MNSSGTLKIARNGYIVMAVIFCCAWNFSHGEPYKSDENNLRACRNSVYCRWDH